MKKIVIVIIVILLVCFLYYKIASQSDRKIVNSKEVIDELRKSKRITTNFTTEEVNIDYKDELINIIERSEVVVGFVNLDGTTARIYFYDENNEIIYSLMYWESEHRIGIKSKESTILDNDIKRFYEILGMSKIVALFDINIKREVYK